MSSHTFTPRAAYDGEEEPQLGEQFDELTPRSRPWQFFKRLDASDEDYQERARNSERYRDWRAGYDMDGPNGKRCYDGAGKITEADMRLLDAALLLNGLDPAVSRHHQFSTDRLAIKGHRVGDLFHENRLKMIRKFFHPANPYKKVEEGAPGYDNLYQVAPVLKHLLKACILMLQEHGKAKSCDEETLGFQGGAKSLKQKCGKFKAAGDGLQADTICVKLGMLLAFAFRGHVLLPTVTVKGKPGVKLCPLHQRVIFLMFLIQITSGSHLAMDNLYNSVDMSHMCEIGETFKFVFPAGWIFDLLVEMELAAAGQRTVEWESPEGVHTIGTLRGNRGSERAYQGAAKLSKAEEEALRSKPILPDRVKARVTDDEAQVMTVSIFDSKWFQMVDTVHTKLEVEQKERVVFDRARGRRGKKKVDILNTPNYYNQIMGFVDLDDLLAWFYRCATYPLPSMRA